MKKLLLLFLFTFSLTGFAGSMNCRVSEMIDYGQWAGFQKNQIDLDSRVASFNATELGNVIKINLKKIAESHQGTTMILKSSVGGEKIELLISPIAESLGKFKLVITQLSKRTAVIASKEITISSSYSNVARIGIDGSGKTTIMECEISPL